MSERFSRTCNFDKILILSWILSMDRYTNKLEDVTANLN